MVIKPITAFLSVCLIIMLLPFASYAAKVSPGSAEEEAVNENNIIMVEKETAAYDSGTVTITVSVADNIILPVTMIMKGGRTYGTVAESEKRSFLAGRER